MDKLAMAAALEIDTHFRLADLFKRYRHVLDTFIQHDHKGTYWLRPEFLLLDDP